MEHNILEPVLLFIAGLLMFRDGWQIYFNGQKLFNWFEKLVFMLYETIKGEKALAVRNRRNELLRQRNWRRLGLFYLVVGLLLVIYAALLVFLILLGQ